MPLLPVQILLHVKDDSADLADSPAKIGRSEGLLILRVMTFSCSHSQTCVVFEEYFIEHTQKRAHWIWWRMVIEVSISQNSIHIRRYEVPIG